MKTSHEILHHLETLIAEKSEAIKLIHRVSLKAVHPRDPKLTALYKLNGITIECLVVERAELMKLREFVLLP